MIGLGYIGKVHLRNSLNLESAELVAVSDISTKALNMARRMGVRKTYQDYQQLLKDNDIEAVIIALPTHLHALCVEKAAEARKHIFLEKPVARNSAEGEKIISVVRKNGVKLMVGYPFRFSPRFQALKRKIESGELGEVQIAYASNISSGPFIHRAESNIPHPVPDWWFNRELTGGGSLMDLGSHMTNLVRWYFGEVSNAKSHLGYRFNLSVEDQATCMLRFKSGQMAIVITGWFSQKAHIKVELLGTVAHVSTEDKAPNRVKTALQLMTGRTPHYYIPYLSELSHFTQCLREDLLPLNSAEDALKDIEAIELAYKNSIGLD